MAISSLTLILIPIDLFLKILLKCHEIILHLNRQRVFSILENIILHLFFIKMTIPSFTLIPTLMDLFLNILYKR